MLNFCATPTSLRGLKGAEASFTSQRSRVLSKTMPAPSFRIQMNTTFAADMTKWVVCACTGALMLSRRDVGIMLFISGALVNAASGKLLKRVINQSRPEGATKSDPGMPSSHATSLSFLSISLAVFIFNGYFNIIPTALQSITASAVVVAAAIATSWRVYCGYHTTPQVLAGWVLGAVNSGIWTQYIAPAATPRVLMLIERFGELFLTGFLLVAGAISFFGADVLRTVKRSLQR